MPPDGREFPVRSLRDGPDFLECHEGLLSEYNYSIICAPSDEIQERGGLGREMQV
jgi:hypothetical protein